MLTPDKLAARTDRAVTAAVEAGRGLGLAVTDPRVLSDVFSVIVHLSPAPVVVRVPTVLPRTVAADPDAQAAQQRSELAVAGWLADRGHPVVPPSPLVAQEPVRRDGFSMTFWQFVEQVTDADPDAGQRFTVTAHLHVALREYPAELAFLMPLDASIPDGLAQLEERLDLLDPADLDRARREWAALEPLVCSRTAFETAFPGADVQPIHGDAPYCNIIVTPQGLLCSDFEHVTAGPVECDLALVSPQDQAVYDAAAARRGLRPLDQRLLRVMESARMLQIVACLALVPQLPMLAKGLRPLLDHWRTTPMREDDFRPGNCQS
ncbi:MAG: aminoglycoside phosphotransferase family protein [Pseudonocardiaceae bacterium]